MASFWTFKTILVSRARRGSNIVKLKNNKTNKQIKIALTSVKSFSVSDSLQPCESQQARPPCPSLTPGVHSNSCPSSWWCNPAIHHLLSPSSPAPNPSKHQCLFQWVNSSHEVLRYRSFNSSISPSNKHLGLISLRMDWLDLLAVQKSLKSLLLYHSSKASILRRSAFFTVQLSHPYMSTGKIIALTRQTLVGKVMSLLLNMLSRLVITFLPGSKRLLISWLQSSSAVILEPQKYKVWHCFHCFPIYFPWSDETGCHDLHFLNVEL